MSTVVPFDPPRVALCTLATGPHLDLLELALPSFERFAELHGYELVVHRRVLAPDRPPSWSKVVALSELVGSFDRVVWVDADAVVVDPSRDLARSLRPGRHLGLAVHRYDGNEVANCGVGVLRGGHWAKRFLANVWAARDLVDHPWWENAAVLRLLGYRLSEPVQQVRTTRAARRFQELDVAWNAIPDVPVQNPFIVHLAGCSQEERLTRMAELAELVRARRATPAHAPAGSG